MMLLSKKIAELDQSIRNHKYKGPEKQIDSLSNIVNFMKDSQRLATQHNILERLYFGGTIKKIYALLNKERINKWFTIFDDHELIEPLMWRKLTSFLEKEIHIEQQKLLYCSTPETKPPCNPSSHYEEVQQGDDNGPFNG